MTHLKYRFETLADLEATWDLPFTVPANGNHLRGYGDFVCPVRQPASAAAVRELLHAQTFPQGVAEFEAALNGISVPAPRSRRRKPRMAAEGDDLDLGRVWDGDLEHAWRRCERAVVVGPSRVLIAVNLSAPFNTPAEDIGRRGIAALALTQRLTEAGYTVELVGVRDSDMSTGTPVRYTATVVVKAAAEEVDIHKTASLLYSALIARGVLFDHGSRVCPAEHGSGLSSTRTVTEDSLDTVGFDRVIIANEVANANQWVGEQLRVFGTEGVS